MGGLSNLDDSFRSAGRVLACDGSGMAGFSVDVGLWTGGSSLGAAIVTPADI